MLFQRWPPFGNPLPDLLTIDSTVPQVASTGVALPVAAIISTNYPSTQASQTLFVTHDARLGFVILNVAVGLISVVYGFDYAFPPEWRGSIYRLSAVVFFALLLSISVVVGFSKVRPTAAAGGHRLLCVLCLIQASMTLFFNLPSRLAAVAIATLWLASWGVARVRGWLVAVGSQ